MTDHIRRRWLIVLAIVAVCAAVLVGAAALSPIYGESDGAVHHEAPNGPNVTSTDVSYDVNVPIRDGTVDFGHTQFTSADDVDVDASEFDSPGLALQNVDAPTRLYINGSERQEIAVDGQFTSVSWDDVSLADDGTELTVDGSGTWGIDLGESEAVFRSGDGSEQILTADSEGYLTYDATGTGSGTLIETRDPEIDRLAPEDRVVISESPVTLEVEFSDADAGLDGGTDEWSVTFYDASDDSVIDQQTVTSTDGTVSADWADVAATESWYVVVEDAYGNSVQSGIREFSLPDQLEIRDEETGELLNDTTVTINAKLYGSSETFEEREVTDGILSLQGLNPDERFTVIANATDYYNREILIRDITKTSRLYLVNESRSVVTNEFAISDNTGRFSGPGTSIELRRPISTGENTSDFRTVAGDVIGASGGFRTELIQGQRYRIVVENDNGGQRDTGPYTADSDGVVPIEVGSTQFVIPDGDTISIGTGADKNDDGSEQIRFEFNDPNNRTTSIAVRIYERGNESNVIHDQVHFPSTGSRFGNLTVTKLVSAEQADKRWTIEYEIRKADGEVDDGRVDVTAGDNTLPLPIPDGWSQIISIGAILLIGGLFSAQNAPLGAIIVPSIAGVLVLIGMLNPVIGGTSVAIALAVGVMYRFATGAAP